MGRKELILGVIDDTIKNFLQYDRRDDEDLPAGAIQEALIAGDITVDEMTERFQLTLWKELGFS